MSDDRISVILGTDKETITLPDGAVIKLRPLSFLELSDAEQKFDAPIKGWDKKLDYIGNVAYLIFLAIKRDKKEITYEQVASWFTLDNEEEMKAILERILKRSGLKGQEKNQTAAPAQ